MKLSCPHPQLALAVVVLGCAFALKLHYTTASADQLRWVLAPTTALVEAVTGISFEFESHAGYLSRERGFLIAASCAGVNFLLTAFLLLTVSRWLRGRLTWRFLPAAAAYAYLVTLVANTTRIGLALWLQQQPTYGWQPAQLHRYEGILVYFGFLLLLFVVSEKLAAEPTIGWGRRVWLPLLLYYATTLGIPLVTRAWREEAGLAEHTLAVLLLPLLWLVPFFVFRSRNAPKPAATPLDN